MSATLNLGTDGQWATKENSLLGYNSESGNYKPLPFDFTRASNGTFVNKAGLIETAASGVPRIDFSDSTSGALLLEPQRTNVLPYSQDFSHSSWLKNDVSIQSGYLAPDGTNNAYKVTSTGANPHLVNTSTGGNTGAKSIYAKTTSGTGIVILFNNVTTYFTITEEWQRFEIEQDGLDFFYAVDFRGASTLTEIIIWGAQSEAGSYATSLINTEGSAVTRVADACNNGGNEQVINSTEGTLYFEGSYPKTTSGSGNKRIAISDGTSSNRVMFAEIGNTGLSALITSQGINSAYITGSLDNLSNFKAAISYKQNDFALWINGLKVATDTSGNVPIGLNEIAFDGGDGTNDFFGKTKDLKVYNTALTDAELAILTTI